MFVDANKIPCMCTRTRVRLPYARAQPAASSAKSILSVFPGDYNVKVHWIGLASARTHARTHNAHIVYQPRTARPHRTDIARTPKPLSCVGTDFAQVDFASSSTPQRFLPLCDDAEASSLTLQSNRHNAPPIDRTDDDAACVVVHRRTATNMFLICALTRRAMCGILILLYVVCVMLYSSALWV